MSSSRRSSAREMAMLSSCACMKPSATAYVRAFTRRCRLRVSSSVIFWRGPSCRRPVQPMGYGPRPRWLHTMRRRQMSRVGHADLAPSRCGHSLWNSHHEVYVVILHIVNHYKQPTCTDIVKTKENSAMVAEGEILWEPSEAARNNSTMTRYMRWLGEHKALHFDSYSALWEWSISHLDGFWESIWQFFGVTSSSPYKAILGSRLMPGAEWFPGARLNYAEQVFRHVSSDRPALIFRSERQPITEISWDDLKHDVASVAGTLRAMGVRPGDRVVGYMP